ncbi:hypothetical protein MNV_90033 [Candidatus Methanoperedens nitroreducens]|uniref:Uncharacterized protein n=1 Tax=Candidatus Methanoperedens nitratireducens TaxID=1392998 RepID=A0A284VUC4_9EURY|nr:hypothetical protein MNV_90033 [Candidatus Methanoperedens nitroreducens]
MCYAAVGYQQERGIQVLDPQEENIKIQSYATDNKGSYLLFISFKEVTQQIGQQGVGEEVHYTSCLSFNIINHIAPARTTSPLSTYITLKPKNCSTTPRIMEPAPIPRSKAAVKVPIAAPRPLSFTLSTRKAISVGCTSPKPSPYSRAAARKTHSEPAIERTQRPIEIIIIPGTITNFLPLISESLPASALTRISVTANTVKNMPGLPAPSFWTKRDRKDTIEPYVRATENIKAEGKYASLLNRDVFGRTTTVSDMGITSKRDTSAMAAPAKKSLGKSGTPEMYSNEKLKAGPIAMATFEDMPNTPIASPLRLAGAISAIRVLAAVVAAPQPIPWNTLNKSREKTLVV